MSMPRVRFALKTRVIVTAIVILATIAPFVIGILTPSMHLTAYQVRWYALLPGAAMLVDVGLLLYFLRRPNRTEERLWLCYFLVAAVVYTFAQMMQSLSAVPSEALFWNSLTSVSVVLVPAVFLFTLAYTNQTDRRFPGLTSLLLTSAGVILFITLYTNIIFINDPKTAVLYSWGYDFRNALGPGAAIILIWYYTMLVAAAIRLISFRRHINNAILRKQSLIFMLALSIMLVGGSITDIVLPALNVTIPPLSGTFGAPMALLIIYGLRRYQILNVSPTLFSNSILGIMHEAVVATDDTFNIIFMNAAAEKLLGAKVTGRKMPLKEYLTHDSLAVFESAFKAQNGAAASTTIDRLDIQRGHARPTPVRLASTMLKLADFEAHVMVLADISAELHTRAIIEHEVDVRTRELHEAQTYLLSSINSLELGFVLVNQDCKIELANGAAAQLLGTDSASLVHEPLDRAAQHLHWNIDLAAKVARVLTTRHGRQQPVADADDGNFFTVFITPVVDGDQTLGATVVIQDVTEAKILERSKDEFFSIASHELRTPLTAIRGNMSMVRDYFPEAMKDESLAGMVNDTHAASVRLIEIVNDFLDMSKLEQGKLEFTLQPVAVQPLLASIQQDLKPMLAEQQATLTLEGLEHLPAVMADDARLRQILYNLISNAIKHGDPGNQITINGDVAGDALHLHVTDTGKGISPENQKLLFHKFQQAGDSILTRDNTKGTGLGLYISRLLADNMHGSVELEHSEVGKGSTFGVMIPVASEATLKAAAAKHEQAGAGAA